MKKATNGQAMNEAMLDLVARRFRILGEPYRLRILQQLEQGELSVGALVAALDGNQPNVSRHLQVLYDAGLVSRRRDGTSVLYAIGDPVIFKLCDLVCRNTSQRTQQSLDRLQGVSSQRTAQRSRQ
ncbi:MAG: helix-turn-helix transcriptional regulator [Acidobacteria bacterium]|nr:helix-turn-helix transcriptional regulator [Acidobacteriota bacterium]